MRRILIAGAFVVAVALAIPAGAVAWTPEDCAAWYETHGANHPDCQDYVPPAPPVETPPPVIEQPPVDTPPVVPPTVVPPVDTPVDTPDVVPAPTPKVHTPNVVEGKEQQGGGKVTAQPVVDTGSTLPFSGLGLVWVAVLGFVLLAGGAACRRFVA